MKTKKKTSPRNKKLKVEISLSHPKAQLPLKAHPEDAGADLVAVGFVRKAHYIEYTTGVNISIPENYVGLIFPRSSISGRGLRLCNGVGVIDPGYTGEIKCRMEPSGAAGASYKRYEEGERIAQLVLVPTADYDFKLVDQLTDTERGSDGFGSTGK